MSRSPIPGSKDNSFSKAKKQVCIYSFPKKSWSFGAGVIGSYIYERSNFVGFF